MHFADPLGMYRCSRNIVSLDFPCNEKKANFTALKPSLLSVWHIQYCR